MTTQELIPYSAWQQIPFVIAIIVLIYLVLVWMGKQNRETRAENAKRESEQRAENAKQAEQWQAFIADIEQQWRDFSREQRKENNACMSDVNQNLGGLTKVISQLVQTVDEMRSDIYAHDNQAKEILDVVKNGRVPVSSRKTKGTDA